MEHVGNTMDAVFGGVVILIMTAVSGYLLKVTKKTGVARTLIRLVWSCILLALCAFSALASYVTYHQRGFNNGAFFVLYTVSVLGYGLAFALFNSNWIGSYADKVTSTWKHFRDLASPDYTPPAVSQEGLPPVAQMVKHLEEVDHRSAEHLRITRQLNQSGSEAVEPLIAALSHNRINARQNAAYALGQIKDERAIKPLIEAFSDTNMRLVAELALSGFGRPAIEPLAEAARSTNRQIKEGAVTALGWCQDTRSVEELDKLFEEWLNERQLAGKEFIGTAQKLLDEYWIPPTKNMTSEEHEALLTGRKEALAKMRKQSNDLDDLDRWWLGKKIAHALSDIGRNALKYPSK